MNLLLTRAKQCMRRTREARREGSSEFADRVMICTRLKETLSGPLRRILDNASASRGNQTRGVYERGTADCRSATLPPATQPRCSYGGSARAFCITSASSRVRRQLSQPQPQGRHVTQARQVVKLLLDGPARVSAVRR